MPYRVEILKDSISPGGVRLTTMSLTYPRIIHAEFMTHRMFSRNASSSRAIPVMVLLKAIREEPFIPESWPLNQRGMQASSYLTGEDAEDLRRVWLEARDAAVRNARALAEQGVHKQIVNRLVEPFSWITVIVSGTDWANFFALRCHPDAQPEIQTLAHMIRDAYNDGSPTLVRHGEWHLPLILPDEQDLPTETKIKVSTGRCARVSYLTHDGRRLIEEDVRLHDRLVCRDDSTEPKHLSPCEHIATPMHPDAYYGNFRGWRQYRKQIEGENITSL